MKQYLFHVNLKSHVLGRTTTKCMWRDVVAHRARAEWAALYRAVCAACKPPAAAVHEADSLSGIHVWTGHNCRLCCQEKGCSRLFTLSCFFFSVPPLFKLLKTTKMENNRRVIPASLCDLDKKVLLWLSDFKKQSSGLKQRSSTGLVFPGTVIPLQEFPLVRLGRLLCRRIVLL